MASHSRQVFRFGLSENAEDQAVLSPIVYRRRLTSSITSPVAVARIRPSVQAVQEELAQLQPPEEAMEEEGVALLDQDKEWGGDEGEGGGEEGEEGDGDGEEEGGREGASDQLQVLDRADDSRSVENFETGTVNIEIESGGTVRILREQDRDSLSDNTDIEENVQRPRRHSVRGGWRLVTPSLDKTLTEDGEQQQQRRRGAGKGKGTPSQCKGKRKREDQEGSRSKRARVPPPKNTSTPIDPPELVRQTRSQARVAAAAAKKVTRSGRKF
jgi:hypothetical protein